MTDSAHRALLPAGLTDVLPPDAAHETGVRGTLVRSFGRYGYEQVKPPLIEFEESLISGSGAATASQTFRMMDPVSQRMLGVRPDMTLQVARIATSRLSDDPRPLRLCYAGEVLRVRGSSLRPQRQFAQVGAEIIGTDRPEADAEVILMASDALRDLGIEDLSVDLGLPTLVPAICQKFGVDPNANDGGLRAALNQKDAAAIADLGGAAAESLGDLLKAVGDPGKAIKYLDGIKLPDEASAQWQHLIEVMELVRAGSPGLKITVDPIETRGYEYHTGITFTLFARTARGELGRGGRYTAGNGGGPKAEEAATGITLFLDSVIRNLPAVKPEKRLFLPVGTSPETAKELRSEGWCTVSGLEPDAENIRATAKGLRCSHYWIDGQISAIDTSEEQ